MSTIQEDNESNSVNMESSSDEKSVKNESVSSNEAQDQTNESATANEAQDEVIKKQEENVATDEQQEAGEEGAVQTESESVSDENVASEEAQVESQESDADTEAQESDADTESDAEAEESDAESEESEADTESDAESEESEADSEAEESDDDTEVEPEEEEDDEETILRKTAHALIDEIAEKLEEPNLFLIKDVVYTIGINKCRVYLERTIKIEEEGGMIIKNRRRTPGGIFFWLAKEDLTKEEIRALFPLPKKPVNKEKRNAARKARKIRKQAELLKEMSEAWASRADVVKDIIKSKNYGKAGSIKVTMIGRPGKIIKQKGFVMTTMRGPARSPSLPKELPNIEASKLIYLVYIGTKQWKRVAKAIKDPEDILIIEGYLGYEKALKKMVIFAQMVTTKLIQQARREKQRLDAEKKKALEAKEEAKKKA